MTLNTLQITLMMMLREKKHTGYQIEKRIGVSHQLVYRQLKNLRNAGVLIYIKVPSNGKPDSIFYSHNMSDDKQKTLISSALLNMRINSKHAQKEIAAVSLCVGFVDNDVIEKWVENFTKFQRGMIELSEKRSMEFGSLLDYEIRYRKFIHDEAISILSKI
ncbi:PadR family transcriptional regulator [Vibrio parahaemolyticus]|nr:PadR family transcriptional regulator [Vibrio parahaemolyticus]